MFRRMLLCLPAVSTAKVRLPAPSITVAISAGLSYVIDTGAPTGEERSYLISVMGYSGSTSRRPATVMICDGGFEE